MIKVSSGSNKSLRKNSVFMVLCPPQASLDDEPVEVPSSTDSELIDHNNYKGIYIDDEPGQK